MRSFIKRSGIFFLTLISITIVFYLLDIMLVLNTDIFCVDKSNNILILGDSHTKFALNDKLIDRAVNFSNEADSYFYSYQKLKFIKKKNPQIDTLLLSFSQHNINESIESRWLLDPSHLNSRSRLYYPLINMDDFLFLLRNKPIDVIKNTASVFLFPLYFFTKGNKAYGGYSDLKEDNLERAIKKYNNKKSSQFSYVCAKKEKKYLTKIKKFCKKNDIQLILVNSPLHKLVNKNIKNIDEFYVKYFSDVPFWDFSQLKLEDQCFGDLVHLNAKGAKIFSEYINMNIYNKAKQNARLSVSQNFK